MIMKITLKSDSMSQTVEIPDRNFLGIIQPPKLPDPEKQVSLMVKQAIEEPLNSATLDELVTAKSRIAIVVDDISRPTPSKDILEVLLEKLKNLSVKNEQIKITIGNGLHRLTTEQEKKKIVGEQVLRDFDVADNQADIEEDFTYIGTTSSDTPVFVNKRVADADVVITLGVIKSHGIAGFTGGAKSILPGVSAKQTILRNHRYDFIEYPKGIVGDADLSFMRRDIEEAAGLLGIPIFIINVVMDEEKNVRGVFAGDMVKAHRKGAELFRQLAEINLEQQADLIIIESNYPSSENLYFALAGLAIVMSAKSPAIKAGGSVILFAQCSNGIGAQIIEKLFNSFETPDEMLEHLRTSAPVEQQWAAQRLAFYVTQRDIGIVTDGIEKQTAKRLRMRYFNTLQQAVDEFLAKHGTDAKVLIIKNTDFLLLKVK